MEQLSDALNPSKPGRKGAVLYGVGGSGKTQMTLRYVEQSQESYKAVFWVDCGSPEGISQCFVDIANMIKTSWPAKDLPAPYRGTNERSAVLSRLRSTMYSWLLILDGADDLGAIDLPSLIPDVCRNGAIIVSSTKKEAADMLRQYGFCSIEIDQLDTESCRRLLLRKSETSVEAAGQANTDAVIKELYGLPLPIEQAGILLRKRIFTFENFIAEYRTHYEEFWTDIPKHGEVLHKSRSLHVILNVLYKNIAKESPDAATLLRLLATLGPSIIPISLIPQMTRVEAARTLGLATLDEIQLLKNISILEQVCLVKTRSASGRSLEYVMTHRAICSWITDSIESDGQPWILSTTYALGSAIIALNANINGLELQLKSRQLEGD
jgi:hypothetical protein